MSLSVSRAELFEMEPFTGVTPRGLRAGVWDVACPEEQTVRINNHLIRLWQSGSSGPTVLFLHAAGATKDVFRAQFDSALAQRYRLVALDLPQDPRGPGADPARLTAALLDRMNLHPDAVVGWASGAKLALALAADRLPAAALVLTGLAACGIEQAGRLAGRRGAVAVLLGADDPLLGAAADAVLSSTALWRGRCHRIPQAGHAPFLESPQVFNHLMSLFLAEMVDRGEARAPVSAPLLRAG